MSSWLTLNFSKYNIIELRKIHYSKLLYLNSISIWDRGFYFPLITLITITVAFIVVIIVMNKFILEKM